MVCIGACVVVCKAKRKENNQLVYHRTLMVDTPWVVGILGVQKDRRLGRDIDIRRCSRLSWTAN